MDTKLLTSLSSRKSGEAELANQADTIKVLLSGNDMNHSLNTKMISMLNFTAAAKDTFWSHSFLGLPKSSPNHFANE